MLAIRHEPFGYIIRFVDDQQGDALTDSFVEQIRRSSEHSSSFLYWSIPYYWLRERRLSRKSVSWASMPGRVISTHRTKGGYQETIRAELWYSYAVNGRDYQGHVVRDGGFVGASANRLVENHPAGQKIEVLVNPNNPRQSYYPSGFGWIEPLLMLFVSSLVTLLIGLIVLFVWLIPMLEKLGTKVRF